MARMNPDTIPPSVWDEYTAKDFQALLDDHTPVNTTGPKCQCMGCLYCRFRLKSTFRPRSLFPRFA